MKKKILIVEDDVDVRRGYHIRLAANDYETMFASDGSSTIAQAQTHRPDLIILDLGLPGGDGFWVLDALAAIPHLAVIPVIVVSGRTIAANRERALQGGAKIFLKKPVDNDTLLDVIKKHLGESVKLADEW